MNDFCDSLLTKNYTFQKDQSNNFDFKNVKLWGVEELQQPKFHPGLPQLMMNKEVNKTAPNAPLRFTSLLEQFEDRKYLVSQQNAQAYQSESINKQAKKQVFVQEDEEEAQQSVLDQGEAKYENEDDREMEDVSEKQAPPSKSTKKGSDRKEEKRQRQ